MTVGDRWICQVCWKSNHPQADECWHCRTTRAIDTDAVEARRVAVSTRREAPEAIPDIVVALPVVIFRGYAKTWLRGGLGLIALPILMGLGGVADLTYLLFSAGIAAGLIVFGFLAGEVADGMRDREAWAFVVGLGLAVVGAWDPCQARRGRAGDPGDRRARCERRRAGAHASLGAERDGHPGRDAVPGRRRRARARTWRHVAHPRRRSALGDGGTGRRRGDRRLQPDPLRLGRVRGAAAVAPEVAGRSMSQPRTSVRGRMSSSTTTNPWRS